MGKRAGTGEIRNWAGGRKFQKQGDGSWKEIVENQFKNISDYAERAIKGEVKIERLSPEEEQGRLRAGKRNVEATLLCVSSQRTDSENTSQFSRIGQEETLRDWAKSEGIWVDYWGQKKYWDFIGEGAEARVYILPGGNRVKKVVWYGFSHEEPINYLDRLALHNFLFPDVPYELVGLTATDRGFAFIVEQPFVKGVVNSSKQDVIGEMERMGFTDRGGNMFTNDDYIVEDLHSGNVVKDENGSLYFIDPIVSLNEEGEGYGGKRKYGKISMPKTEIKKSMNIFPQVKEYFEQLLSRDSKLTVENGIEVAKNLLEKAKTGKYVDNEENRKLGRVGMTYGQYQGHIELERLQRAEKYSRGLDLKYQQLTDRISEKLKSEGFPIDRVSKSTTTFGKSWYLKLDDNVNGDQIRISDHSVGDRRIMNDPTIAYIDFNISDKDLEDRIDLIVRYLKRKKERQSELSEIYRIERQKEEEFLQKRDEVYSKLEERGLGISTVDRTYQDLETIKEKHPDWSNIFQENVSGAFKYSYTKPKNPYTSKGNMSREYLAFLEGRVLEKSIMLNDVLGIGVEDSTILNSFFSIDKNTIEKAKRAQVGEIRTRSGQKFQKMGDGSWKPVKEGGKKPAKEEGNLKQSKKGEEQPKPSKGELKVYAKNTSEASLQGAIKGSADPEIRRLAYEELARRKKEEIPQEEDKVEGKKEEVKGRSELAPKFTELNEKHSLSRLPVGIPENEVEVNEDGSKGNWILKWVDPKTGKQMTSYSKEFLQQNAQEKWNRIKNVSSKDISSITSNSQKLLSSDNPKEAQSAAIVNIIAMTGLRPGSQKGFDETQNRGVTTLAKENVKIKGSKIYFEFIGKSYKNNTAEIDSKPLAEYLGKLMKEKKDRDFLFDVDDKTVREIFKEKISPKSEIKLKDMRTYVATDLARSVLEDSKIPPPPVPEKGLKTAVKKKLTEVFKIVSEQLNNTPSMAKSSYVHPEVIDSWLKSLGVELAGFSKGIELDKLVSNENDEDEEDVEEYPLPEWWEDEEDEIEKGISEEKTPKEIADHHGVSFEKILEQLKIGVQVEYEHTDDTIEARRIALDHLMEIPDYYTRLAKMEAEAKGDIEKGKRDLSKYIKKRKLVTRGGKTFLQTVYENPEGVESPDRGKAEKELEKTYDFPELATGEHITIKGKKKSLTGELIGFYEYKGELYLTVKGSDGKSSEILVKSAKETPITKEEGKRTAEKAFPTEFDPSKVGVVLGGSSKVQLYDEKFVLKTARERDSGVRQLQYGQIADDVYRMMGIDTPKSKLFGDKKITEFVNGTEYGNLKGEGKNQVDKILQKGFLLDCVLANWDVIGDNVILGDDGKVYRIDNDGVFDIRAKGGSKDFDLGIQPTVDSMIKHNSQFKDIPREELARQAEELYKNRGLIQKRILAENIKFKEISNRVVSRIEDAYKIFTAKEEPKPAKEEPKPWDGERGEYGSSTTNEYFKDWDSFEFEGNGGIKDAIKKKITEVERDQESSYKGLASQLGMGVEEFKYKLQKSLEETIQQCDFFTAQGFEEHDGSTVDKIFKSGRFKTQFDPELKKERVTGGSFDPEYRSSVEKRYFGFTDDKRIHENRPVYGYWTGNTNGILNSEGGIPPS